MPEPNTTVAAATGGGLVAAAIVALGPWLGPFVIVAVAAFFGGFIAATDRKTDTMRAAVLIVVRGVVVAVAATGLIAHGISLMATVPGLSAADYLWPVAFVIGWQPRWALDKLRRMFGGANQEGTPGEH